MNRDKNWWWRALWCGAGLVLFSEALVLLGIEAAGIIAGGGALLAVMAIPGAYRFCRDLWARPL